MEVYIGLWRGPTRMPIKTGAHDAEGRVLAASIAVSATPVKDEPRKRYVVRLVAKAPKIDGKLDEAAWGTAPSTGPFVNTMTGGAGPAEDRGQAALGQEEPLRRVSRTRTRDVWAKLDKRDDKLWTAGGGRDHDRRRRQRAELRRAPGGAERQRCSTRTCPSGASTRTPIDPKLQAVLVELEAAGQGARRRDAEQARGHRTRAGRSSSRSRSRTSRGWTTKTPLKLPPAPGDVWRINMFRMDVPSGKPQQAARLVAAHGRRLPRARPVRRARVRRRARATPRRRPAPATASKGVGRSRAGARPPARARRKKK